MAIVTQSEEFKKFIPVSAAMFNGNWQFAAEEVEENYIQQILGTAQYNALHAAYQAALPSTGTDMPEAMQKLWSKCMRVLAPLTFYKMAKVKNVQIGDNGLRTATGQDSEQARQWMVYDLYEDLYFSGLNAVEKLYAFLEANEETYALWKGSDAYTKYKRFLINNATEFHKHVNINESRWTYLAMVQAMENVELLYVEPVIGAPYFAELKAKIKGDAALSSHDRNALQLLQKATAHLTIAMAAPDLSLRIDASGITVLTDASTEIKTRRAADQNQVASLAIAKEQLGQAFLTKVKTYLDQNADSITTYKNGPTYVNPDAPATDSGNAGRKVFRM